MCRYCVWTANAGNNCDDFKCPEKKPLPHTEITIAELLSKAGYATYMMGKWHLGDFIDLKGNPKWPVSHPGQHGFEEWWATERSAPSANMNCACFDTKLCIRGHYTNDPPCTNYYTVSGKENGGKLVNYSKPENGDDANYIVDHFGEYLKDRATNRDTRPFFAYLPFHNVHVRYLAYEGYIEEYFKAGYSLGQIDYYGAISAMDAAVGRVRSLLKQYNISSNTMLWFTSDNGYAAGSPGSAAFLRGHKAQLYEGGIRVPGIIEWPAYISQNRATNYSVVSSDLLPTACDLLKLQCPTDRPIDGQSILPLLKGTSDKRGSSIQWMFSVPDNFDGSYNAAISDDRYKLFAKYSKGKMSSSEFYDLVNDPSESKDLSESQGVLAKKYQEDLETWRQSVIKSATEVVKCMDQ